MPAPSGNKSSTPSSRLRDLGIVLPSPPTPLGTYLEASDAGDLLFRSGTLPVVNRKLAVSDRLGENLSVKERQKVYGVQSLVVGAPVALPLRQAPGARPISRVNAREKVDSDS